MRIIRRMAAVALVIAIAPQTLVALAAESDSNETKINFETKKLTLEEGTFLSQGDIKLALATKGFEGYMQTVKSEEDSAREEILEKYADKRAKAVYPEGKFKINASAYTAAADECGKSDGITASGLKVKEKETLACPPQFPFGTKIKIDGMGTYVCQDRGGAIKGNHIDIYMETKTEAFAFGRRILDAEVIM